MTNEEALLIDIKFQLDMYGSGQGSAEDTLAKIRKIISSPSLTDDQQVVLEWMKWKRQEGSQPIECLYALAFGDAIESVIIAYINLTDTEQFQVLAAFASYGLEGEG